MATAKTVREAEALATIEANGAGGADKAIDYRAAKLDDDFALLVKNRQRVDAKIKELSEAKAAITADIETAIAECGHKSVQVDDWRVTYVPGKAPSRKLDPKLLLKRGVAATVIAACYVEGQPGAPYVLVTEAK